MAGYCVFEIVDVRNNTAIHWTTESYNAEWFGLCSIFLAVPFNGADGWAGVESGGGGQDFYLKCCGGG